MPPSPIIAGVARACPEHYYPQAQLSGVLRELWKDHSSLTQARLDALHASVQVRGRHLAVAIEEHPAHATFEKRNEVWAREARRLGAIAVRKAAARAGIGLQDIDALCFVSTTGLATPSIDAGLVNALGLRRDVKRLPVFGLGCVAGVAGTARLSDLLRGFPTHTAVLVSVELCSLTVQRDDVSVPNVIAGGLFGDGAAAVVLRGGDTGAPGPRVVDSQSVFYPGTEDVMGWEFLDSGFKLMLSADIPKLVVRHARADVDAFLARHGLARGDITHWVAHTGGPKVLEAFESSLELPDGALARSWESLRAYGNLSSASVLYVLADFLESDAALRGDLGLMMALGPGFCAEMVLLQW